VKKTPREFTTCGGNARNFSAMNKTMMWQCDSGPTCQQKRKEREGNGSGLSPGGLWAACAAGPKGFPEALFSFSFVSPFLFLFSYLEIFSNSILIQK
jgi:hypothetical protein